MIHLRRHSRCPIQFLRRLQVETIKKGKERGKKKQRKEAGVSELVPDEAILFSGSSSRSPALNDCILLFGDAVFALFFFQPGSGDFAVALRRQSAATDRSNRDGQSRRARCRPFI